MDRIVKSNSVRTRFPIAAMQGILFALIFGAATANAGSPPSFSQDPTNQTVLTESVATITSLATSSDPFTYQWLFNNSPLPQATNSSLSITNVALTNAGRYAAVAENSSGATTSLVATLTVIPRPGTVDSRFNIGTGPNSPITAICALPDGSAYVGGLFTSINGSRRWLVARLRHDGTVDPQFRALRLEGVGNTGTPVPSIHIISSIAIQADGKVIVGGKFNYFPRQTPSTPIPVSLIRLNPDGSEDSFVPFDGQPSRRFSVAVAPDGMILSLEGFRLVRYFQNGTVDESFGTNNVFNNFTDPSSGTGQLLIQPDGKILVGIYNVGSYQQTNQVKGVVRINTDGTVDKTFSVTTQIPLVSIQALHLDSIGRIVVGMTGWGFPIAYTAVRLNADGSQDNSFLPTTSGYVLANSSAIIEQTGGRLLLAGRRSTNGTEEAKVQLLRFETNGAVDPTFRATLVGADSGSVTRMAALPDGSILLGGNFTQFNGDPTNRYLTRIYGDQIAPTAPVIAHHPSDLSLLSGTNLTLSSVAAGTPPIQYQWLKQNVPVTPGVRVSGDTNFVLSVSNLTRADSGLYRLMASNSIGVALSDPASVVVRSPQRILAPDSLPDGSLRLRFADKDGSLAGVNDLSRFRVESSTNLVDWVSVTNTLSIGSSFLEIIDTNIVSRSASFYRVIEQ